MEFSHSIAIPKFKALFCTLDSFLLVGTMFMKDSGWNVFYLVLYLLEIYEQKHKAVNEVTDVKVVRRQFMLILFLWIGLFNYTS